MLKELLEDGVLTEIEFTEEKQHILATLNDLKKWRYVQYTAVASSPGSPPPHVEALTFAPVAHKTGESLVREITCAAQG